MQRIRSLVICGVISAAGLLPAGDTVDFTRDVRPLLNEHCVSCHGGVKQAGDLSFVHRDHVYRERESGVRVIVPGDVEESELVRRITTTNEAERMPPVDEHPEGLSDNEIDTLITWVREGAVWQVHWSFVPPQRQALPTVSDAEWCRQRMDHFVLARLDEEGLTPSPDADVDRWLRRVTLDLIGLPPTLEDQDAFRQDVSHRGEAAYEAVVDRLLDSPRFGERWASMWLDHVRYADSKGLGLDGRRTIWRYRDWVIDAFNRDLPYDEFTVKQLAGDLLPDPTLDDLIATACHRTTQSNEEGGTDDEQFRVEAVVDRINTTWQVWQGVTFGCTQCHDHPYDPLLNTDYYRFMAYFNNTADCDVDSDAPLVQMPLDASETERASELDQQIADIKESLRQSGRGLVEDDGVWQPLRGITVESTDGVPTAVEPKETGDEYHTLDAVRTKTGFVVTSPLPSDVAQLTALRLTISPLDPEAAVVDPEWGFVLSHLKAQLISEASEEPIGLEFVSVIGDEPQPFLDPELSLDAENDDGFAAYSRIHYPRTAAFVLAAPVDVPAEATLWIKLAFNQSSGGSHPLVARRGSFALSSGEEWSQWLDAQQFDDKRAQLTALKEQRKAIASVDIPVMRERVPQFARLTHMFDRGNYLNKTEAVAASLPPSLADEDSAGAQDRLAMARWFVSPENPLAARVAVNRLWTQLFGTGLVATQEDFGSSGDRPSHPELLDDLAFRFMYDMHWSQKQLLRELTLSSTYRQQSTVNPELCERDPDNRLLARGPRHRLSAEVVRDQALAIAGLLSDKMYGPPVHPPIPDGVWNPFQAADKWTTAEPGDENRYRRSVYIYVKRSIPFPMFASFDTPSREFCTSRRVRSNTPLQALMTLNDTTFSEASLALGRRMLASHGESTDQLEFGLRLATCREPSADEVAELASLYDGILKEQSATDDEASSVSPNERAMGIVASVLLNLDELLTK
ncbi:MAG: PSD1 domain-containing protein [Planctomycetaceae bacterium]|nr:PSD1 domain-containing protein [Planctomycetaceae bacterium]